MSSESRRYNNEYTQVWPGTTARHKFHKKVPGFILSTLIVLCLSVQFHVLLNHYLENYDRGIFFFFDRTQTGPGTFNQTFNVLWNRHRAGNVMHYLNPDTCSKYLMTSNAAELLIMAKGDVRDLDPEAKCEKKNKKK